MRRQVVTAQVTDIAGGGGGAGADQVLPTDNVSPAHTHLSVATCLNEAFQKIPPPFSNNEKQASHKCTSWSHWRGAETALPQQASPDPRQS